MYGAGEKRRGKRTLHEGLLLMPSCDHGTTSVLGVERSMWFSVEPVPFRRLESPREVDIVGGKVWEVPTKEGRAREGE